MKKILIMLLIISTLILAIAPIASASVYVRGYYRSNGTYVAPHYRSNPDSYRYNNYSSYGNYNPYTGAYGYRSYYGYYR